MSVATDSKSAGLPVRAPGIVSKAALGLTGVIENAQWQIYETFLIFYYAQVLGLKGSLAGLALAISIVIDAFTDPMIGAFSDSFRGRYGRRHTLMYVAIVPTALFIWLLFSPPAGLTQWLMFGWLLVCCVGVRVVSSLYSVPAAAVAAELSEEATQRAELGIWRQGTSAVALVLLMSLIANFALTPTAQHADGRLNPANYSKLALLMVAVLSVCALLGALGTARPVRAFEQLRALVRPQRVAVWQAARMAWQALLELRNVRAIFLGLLFAGIMGSYFRALNLHLGTYFWELTTKQTGNWLNATQIAVFATAIGCRFLVTRIEPRALYIGGVALTLAAYVGPPLLRLINVLPDNSTPALVQFLFIANTLVGCGTGLIMCCSLVLFAEAADEYAYEKRQNRTGMVLAFLPLGNKLASSFGKLLAGIVIEWIAFPVGQQPQHVAGPALQSLGLAAVSVTLVAGLIALYFYLSYRLPRERHQEILRGLAAMRNEP